MRTLTVQAIVLVLFCTGVVWCAPEARAEEDSVNLLCHPQPGPSPTIELGKAGQFSWTCSGGEKAGNGFYIVFIRPAGTYVLLKVSQGRRSFEFTPDAPGMWRWIVINTDPDRTKPDVESEPGYFQVILTEATER
jgi:hypothetical protein